MQQPCVGAGRGAGSRVRAVASAAASVARVLAAVLLLCSVLLVVALVGEGVAGADGQPSDSGSPGAFNTAAGKASDLDHGIFDQRAAPPAPRAAPGDTPRAPDGHDDTIPHLGQTPPVRTREPLLAAVSGGSDGDGDGDGDAGDLAVTGGRRTGAVPAAPAIAPPVRHNRGEAVLVRDLARERIQAIESVYRALVEYPDPQGYVTRPTHLALNTWGLEIAGG
jgi:hypothetical protein